jgi:hypothetical protein
MTVIITFVSMVLLYFGRLVSVTYKGKSSVGLVVSCRSQMLRDNNVGEDVKIFSAHTVIRNNPHITSMMRQTAWFRDLTLSRSSHECFLHTFYISPIMGCFGKIENASFFWLF